MASTAPATTPLAFFGETLAAAKGNPDKQPAGWYQYYLDEIFASAAKDPAIEIFPMRDIDKVRY